MGRVITGRLRHLTMPTDGFLIGANGSAGSYSEPDAPGGGAYLVIMLCRVGRHSTFHFQAWSAADK